MKKLLLFFRQLSSLFLAIANITATFQLAASIGHDGTNRFVVGMTHDGEIPIPRSFGIEVVVLQGIAHIRPRRVESRYGHVISLPCFQLGGQVLQPSVTDLGRV